MTPYLIFIGILILGICLGIMGAILIVKMVDFLIASYFYKQACADSRTGGDKSNPRIKNIVFIKDINDRPHLVNIWVRVILALKNWVSNTRIHYKRDKQEGAACTKSGERNSKSLLHNYSKAQRLVLGLAAIIGACLACVLCYFLNQHLNFLNPSPLEQLLLLVIGAVFVYVSYYSFSKLKLLKRSDRNYSEHNSSNEKEYTLHDMTINQSHKAERKTQEYHNSAKYTQKHPTYLVGKVAHVKFLLPLFRRIINRLRRAVNQNRIKPISSCSP